MGAAFVVVLTFTLPEGVTVVLVLIRIFPPKQIVALFSESISSSRLAARRQLADTLRGENGGNIKLDAHFSYVKESLLWNVLEQARLLMSSGMLLALEVETRTYSPSAGYEFSPGDR